MSAYSTHLVISVFGLTIEFLLRWFWSCTLVFLYKGSAEKVHHFTLLDGEMIIDTVPDSRKQERRYLIYDMMAINSVSIVEVRYEEVLQFLELNFFNFLSFIFIFFAFLNFNWYQSCVCVSFLCSSVFVSNWHAVFCKGHYY